MAEKEVINPENPVVAPSSPEDKQSNKTFTQSEHDEAIAREQKRIADQYKDYADIKKKAEKLEKQQKERELAEKTEVEQLTIKNQELLEAFTKIESEKKRLETLGMKSDLLSKAEFANLPRAYKSMVTGEDADSIIASANEILKEYESDTKKLAPGVNYHPPSSGQPPSTGNRSPQQIVKDIFAGKASERGVFPINNK